MPKTLSRAALLLVIATVAITSLVRKDVLGGETNTITWDGYGYYAYLPAVFVYGDVTDYAFVDQHFADYEISGNVYQVMEAEDGSKFPIYNAGLAVVWTPGFLAAHAVAKLTDYPADGLSFPYQLAVVLTSWLVLFLGLLYLRRFLLAYFPDWTVALTLVGVGLGTNLFFYAVEKPEMTHGYLFAGYAILLYQFQKLLEEENNGYPLRRLFLLGLVAGLMCLTRSSEIVLFAIPSFHGLRNWSTLKRNFWRTLPIFGVALAVFGLQLLYYKIGTGAWFRDGYAGLGFDWTEPHLYEGFFGYRRGWLVYTPLMALALLGIGWLRRGWLLPVLVFVVGNCYILFSWHIWWYGNTFGSRPVVQSYALLALPLAAVVAWLGGAAAGARWRSSKAVAAGEASSGPVSPKDTGVNWKIAMLALLIVLFATLNLFQHWQYNQRILPLDFVNRTYYWHVFGKTELDKKDYVYLDTNEKLPAGDWDTTTLTTIDTSVTQPPKTRREFTNLHEHRAGPETTNETWLRSTLDFSYHGDSYDKWKFPAVVTEHKRGDETLKWVQVKIPPLLENPQRDAVTFSVNLLDYQEGDVVKQYLWNLSRDSMTVYRYEADLLRR